MSRSLVDATLAEAYATERVQAVLALWAKSWVRADRVSAIGLRHAVQVEVIDYLVNERGLTYLTARVVAASVAVGARQHPEDGPPILTLAYAWQFTANGDDETGTWVRMDVEEEKPS